MPHWAFRYTIHISELDIRGPNAVISEIGQRDKYAELFPVMWEHRSVIGITVWGYIEGRVWKPGAELIRADGSEKPAMTWLKSYMSGANTTVNVWLEAECGSVGSLWDKLSDGSASNSRYVVIKSGNNSTSSAPTNSAGYINLSFSVNATGTYSIWFRTICPTANDDSFWLRMNNGSWVQWNNITLSSSWNWAKCPTTFSLSSGTHTLTIAYREDGARLDKIYITNTSTTPSGTGSTASNLCSAKDDDFAENNGVTIPLDFNLVQNYPNPFNPFTIIQFSIPENSFVSLKVYNSIGEEVVELAGKEYSTGTHKVIFDASNLASGTYFYTLRARNYVATRKMILQK